MSATGIEWTQAVWNPVTGCDRVSPGCDHCYALTMAKRLKGMGQPKYQTDGDPRTSGPGFGIAEHPDVLAQMLRRRKPARVFVNSMSDLFHSGVSDRFIARVFAVMALTPHITYQLLTKRHARMRSLLTSDAFRSDVADRAYLMAMGEDVAVYGRAREHAMTAWMALPSPIGERSIVRVLPWPLPNVHLGVSAEDQKRADQRVESLWHTPAAVRWVSAEPLLNEVTVEPWISRLSWVVAGGESGPNARPMHPRWARRLRDECARAGVPFLFKQWGEWAPAPWKGEDGATHAFTGGFYQEAGQDVEGFMALGHSPTSLERDDRTPGGAQGMRRVGKKAAGRLLDGVLHDAYPEVGADA